jgi:DNA mismatch endonuclease, patch repair protein
MKRQGRRDTAPELAVRKALRDLGHRYTVKNSDLPGSPDAANRYRHWAVFVHGCYWHQHPGCPRATIPKANREWWLDKFNKNRERDERAIRELRDQGFDVEVIWECETRDSVALGERLHTFLSVRSTR